MPVLPEKNIASPVGIVKASRKRIFIYLVIFIVVFVLAMVAYNQVPSKFQKINTPEISLASIVFPNESWKKRVAENLELAKTEKNSEKRLALYEDIFSTLTAAYSADFKAETRVELVKLSQFIKREFPEKFDAERFKVICLDSGCGRAQYPPEITNINVRLNVNEKIDIFVRDGIHKKFEAGAISTETNEQWDYYLQGFSLIVSETRRLTDEDLVKIASDLRDFLKQAYPQNYKEMEEKLPNALVI